MFFMSIDTKIMLHRATEFAKDASLLQKKGEIAQAYIVKQTNENTQMQKIKISDLKNKDDNTIQREKESKGQQNGNGGKKNAGPVKPGGDEPEVAGSQSIIDIRI